MIILIQCTDQIGLVAEVTSVFAKRKVNIISLREHVDKLENRFYMRLDLDLDVLPNQNAKPNAENQDAILGEENHYVAIENGESNPELADNFSEIENELRAVLPPNVILSLSHQEPKKVVVLVTKEYHCLADILIRNYFGTLNAVVQGVIGNHAVLENICERFDIPFFLVKHETGKIEEFESRITEKIDHFNPDYIVLAKFMRILTPGFVARFPSKLINIHHSFLPAFIGANPYRQAFDRGVKLLGATAHFVTNELDEGPIIAQQTISVSHSLASNDMVEAGKEVETAVLIKALKLVLENRVFVHKNKTVVFEK